MLQDLPCIAKNYIMVQLNLQPMMERKRAAYEPFPDPCTSFGEGVI